MSASKKLFTPDEVEILRSNPYTLSVTSKTIRFTLAFKQAFWTKRQAGERLQDIYSDLGYDVSILGDVRIKTIANSIRKEALSKEGLHENNSLRAYRPDQVDYSGMPQNEAMVRMQHEILYLRQELEFIKKIIKPETSGGREK